MVAKRIIPCLDVQDGQVVKGIQFERLRAVGDPAELASRYEREGADEVVFLDISASREGRETLYSVVERTAKQLFVPLTVGGGIRTVEDVRRALRAGADKVSVNTAAVQDPAIITASAETFGAQCVVVAIDAKRHAAGWRVHTHGGSRATDLDAVEWARRAEQLGAGEILLTSMDADGTKNGYDVALTRAVCQAVRIPVIASGGCGSVQHMVDVFQAAKADAALAASIFHYGETTVRAVKEHLAKEGIEVRP